MVMIRGVNKNVIEISDTGNDCFERAILFVRAETAGRDGDQLRRRAADYLQGLRLRPGFYPRWRPLFALLRLLGAAGVGAAITVLVLTL